MATLSIFVEPLTRDFGWSRTALSGAVSLGGLLAALVSPLIGPLLDRRGSRLVLVALFMAADDDPLFLQIKQANASVLEPYAGKSLHSNHGQRVVAGQRLMQSASDMFLGWS